MCKYCDEKFRDMSDLIVHENSQVHSKERKEQIKVIDKFSKNITLPTEKLIPVKEKTSSRSFQCINCKIKFQQVDELISHKRVHIGERIFPCKYCDKSFKSMVLHKSHEGSHKDESSVDSLPLSSLDKVLI